MPIRSLRWKWTGVLALAAGLPLAAMAWAVLRQERAALSLAEKSLQLSVIEQVSSGVTRRLDGAAEAVRRAADALFEAGGDPDLRLLRARAEVGRADALAEVAAYGPDGALIDAIEHAGGPPAPAPAPRLDPAARPGWQPPGAGPPRFVERRDDRGAPRAWLVGALRPDVLDVELAASAESAFGKNGRALVVIVETSGRVAAASDLELVGQTLRRPFMGPSWLGAPFGLTTEYAVDGEARVGTVRTLPGERWAVLVERPRALAFASLSWARRALLLDGALALLGAVLLGGWLARRTTRPVEQLVGLTRAYAERRFQERSPVRTGDELEALGDAMTRMAEAIVAREQELERRAAVERDLSRFLPATVAREIASGARPLKLGGERRALTVLFADVVAFTSFAESAPPERVVELLNELFTVLSEVVFRHGGTVDKFIGDSMLALFGVPEAQADHPRRALAAAEDMHRFVEASRSEWRERYGVDVRLGVGVHAGEALVGNLGSAARMEYTAIGDVVNVAARLETMARPGQTLVTAEVARAAGEAFAFNSLGTHPLRGRQQPLEILELK